VDPIVWTKNRSSLDGVAGIVKLSQISTIFRHARPTPRPQINKLAVVLGCETANKFLKLTIPHAEAIVACDFFVAITTRFRILYVFVAMEISSRRKLVPIGVTDHPTAEWTIQQFREFMDEAPQCRFVIHDRHAAFSVRVDSALGSFGVQVLRTPVHSPTANDFCERLYSV
jgi:hypothetical protein